VGYKGEDVGARGVLDEYGGDGVRTSEGEAMLESVDAIFPQAEYKKSPSIEGVGIVVRDKVKVGREESVGDVEG